MIADEILSIKRVRSMHELKYDVWPNPNVELGKNEVTWDELKWEH